MTEHKIIYTIGDKAYTTQRVERTETGVHKAFLKAHKADSVGGNDMKATLTKIEKFWTIIIEREDGTRNDYRFSSKAQAQKWARNIGVEI